MWAEVSGERRKVACGPCIRGHRSSNCDHRDRVLLEVRKPGRPLSSCPHAGGPCSCERVTINYTSPKTSGCACPSDEVISAASRKSNRVQKSLQRKSTSRTVSTLEKATKASHLHDAGNDAPSELTRTSTGPVLAVSECNVSSSASSPSSASLTPRLQRTPSRQQGRDVDVRPPDARLTGATAEGQPGETPASSTNSQIRVNAPLSRQSDPFKQQRTGRESSQQQARPCCRGAPEQHPGQLPATKSCCANPNRTPQHVFISQTNSQQNVLPTFTNSPQFPQHNYFQTPLPGPVNGFDPSVDAVLNYIPNPSININMPILDPLLSTTHSQLRSVYQPPGPVQMPPIHDARGASSSQAVDRNCHCGGVCGCFRCTACPNNAIAMEYARMMYHYMGMGVYFPPIDYLRTYSQLAGYGAEVLQHVAPDNDQSTDSAQHPPEHFLCSTGANSIKRTSNPSANVLGPSQHCSPQPYAQNRMMQDAQGLSASNQDEEQHSPTSKAEETAADPLSANSLNNGNREDALTLSASSHPRQEFVLPSGNDATGLYQCSEGCECVGCIALLLPQRSSGDSDNS